MVNAKDPSNISKSDLIRLLGISNSKLLSLESEPGFFDCYENKKYSLPKLIKYLFAKLDAIDSIEVESEELEELKIKKLQLDIINRDLDNKSKELAYNQEANALIDRQSIFGLIVKTNSEFVNGLQRLHEIISLDLQLDDLQESRIKAHTKTLLVDLQEKYKDLLNGPQ